MNMEEAYRFTLARPNLVEIYVKFNFSYTYDSISIIHHNNTFQ